MRENLSINSFCHTKQPAPHLTRRTTSYINSAIWVDVINEITQSEITENHEKPRVFYLLQGEKCNFLSRLSMWRRVTKFFI